MQRLNATLAPLWQAARQNQTEADHIEHRYQVNQLLHDAANLHKEIIPEHLHCAGPERIRHVGADDIARLRLGHSLALATRRLLCGGAGNQQLPVAASQGDAMANLFGIREGALQGIGLSDALPALAVVAQGGACNEHFSVAFELARTLDLPVATVANDQDHGALVLHPELGDKAVIVDAWTTFPGSCLMDDSAFTMTNTLQVHRPGTGYTSNLNLPMVQRLRQQLESTLGPEPIMHAMLEQSEYNAPEKFDGLVTADQRRRRLSQVLLQDCANAISDTAKRRIVFHKPRQESLARVFRDRGSPQRRELTRRVQLASAPALNALKASVNQEALHAPDRRATRQCTSTGSVAITPFENIAFTAEITASAVPSLFDKRLPSENIRYMANDGSHFSTITAPRWIIKAAEEGVIASEALNFPDGYR
jgi:hypothetical protein